MKVFRAFGTLLASLGLVVLALVATLQIYYSNLPTFLRTPAAGIFALIAVVMIAQGFRRRRRWSAFLVLFAAVFFWWWVAIPPSNDRNWQPDVRVLPWAEFKGDLVTVHNIRNCEYRTENDYTVHYYDRTFDLKQLTSLDAYLVYWGSPSIAHTMLSFGFKDGKYLCFSIETRKEVGEGYSAIKGFFKQFELTYIVADERDLVRLRTNYRENGKGEDVYLYRLKVPAEFARKVFLDYLHEVNSLKDHPEWYRALSTNCTTSILRHTAKFNPDSQLDWRIIVNGYIDEMMYERKRLDQSLPFTELKKRSYINERAKAVRDGEDFSRLIRIGLPGVTP